MEKDKLTIEDVENAIGVLQRFSMLLGKYYNILRTVQSQLSRMQQSSYSFSRPEDFMGWLMQQALAARTQQAQSGEMPIKLDDEEAKRVVEKYRKRKGRRA